MAKYTIDIPDDTTSIRAERVRDYITFYKEIPMDKLTPYTEPDEDEIRQKVEQEVWELARTVRRMSISDWGKCFELYTLAGIFDLNYSEAKAKYEEWQKQKDEIRVGDEIVVCDETAVVLWLNEYGNVGGYVYSDGKAYINGAGITSFTKTGRHFSEVAELLKKMKEE